MSGCVMDGLFKALFSLSQTQRRHAHSYKRWALEAKEKGDLANYERWKVESDRSWKEAKSHLQWAIREKDWCLSRSLSAGIASTSTKALAVRPSISGDAQNSPPSLVSTP